MSNSDYQFVIEYCQNCSVHAWNTRHDEAKYEAYKNGIKAEIQAYFPNAVFHENCIPADFAFSENYTQLVPDSHANNTHYDMIPRLGAFEVSTVVKTADGRKYDVLLYSKLKSLTWPHF